MTEHVKFENLETELVDLPEVFKNSLQNDVLTIKKLIKDSDKYKHVCTSIQDCDECEYVIFSSYIDKKYHENEIFIFINKTGKVICNLSGRELDLYNMITDCDNLIETEDYACNK